MPYLQPSITRAGASASDAVLTGTDLYLTQSATGDVNVDGDLTVSGAIGGASTFDLSGNFSSLGKITTTGDIQCSRLQSSAGIGYSSFVGPGAWTGLATLVAGTATVTGINAPAGSTVILSRSENPGQSPAVGTLSLQLLASSSTPGLASITVRSLDSAGALVATDVGDFYWLIIGALNV